MVVMCVVRSSPILLDKTLKYYIHILERYKNLEQIHI